MKATPENQRDLLELQRLDLETMRTQHQMRKHPLREKLEELSGRSDDVQRFTVALGADIEDRRRDLTQLEGQIQKVVDRGKVQQQRLDEGKVPMRDMSAVEHEIGKIGERRDELEGALLALMEEIETKEGALVAAQRQIGELADDEKNAQQELEQDLAEPKAKLEDLNNQRNALRETLPADVVAEYDRLAERQGLPVVLELKEGYLVNAPVSLSAAELGQAAKAPADQLWISGETGYLIARP